MAKLNLEVQMSTRTVGAFIYFSGSLPIYNCCTSNQRCATLEQIIEMGKEIQNEVPLDKMIWAPGGGLTRCRFYNFFIVIFLQLLPAIVLDFLISIKGQKPL